MGGDSNGPTVIRSIAVSGEDVAAALESTRRSGRDTILRVTPPFSGRMRARLHVAGTEQYDEPAPIHIHPGTLVADSAPDYPSPDQTEATLRADPDEEYSQERHHDRHADAVADWREAVRHHIVDTTTIDTPTGEHEIDVTVLG